MYECTNVTGSSERTWTPFNHPQNIRSKTSNPMFRQRERQTSQLDVRFTNVKTMLSKSLNIIFKIKKSIVNMFL